MLISHNKKFIFVHIYKTGGTSIRQNLHRFSRAVKDNSIPTHSSIIQIKKKHPKEFSSYYKFAFVRNPWDWLVSVYFHILKRPDHKQYEIVKEMGFDKYIQWRADGHPCAPTAYPGTELIPEQNQFLCDKDGKVIVDFVGRFENLVDDFEKICKHVSVPCKLGKLNSSPRTTSKYQDMYNDSARKIVEDRYRKDIEMFGYEFK